MYLVQINNVISLSDLLGFVIGLIGIVLTIITISLIIRQRNDQYKPFIVINKDDINTSMNYLKRVNISEEFTFQTNPGIKIINIGNSVAKHIVVRMISLKFPKSKGDLNFPGEVINDKSLYYPY